MAETESGAGPDSGGTRMADKTAQGVVAAFGQTMKTLRLRAGMERQELGRRLGYSAATIASFEQGRRIPSPRAIDGADEVLAAEGLLKLWKEELERAQYPVFFQGMAQLEKQALELLEYDALLINGLLQTEDYTRALFAMRRPALDPDTVEQRVSARLARQAVFDRRPTPLLSFVMTEAVLRHRYGGKQVLRGQLEHLLLTGHRPNVELQVMPVECEDNAGMGGPFTVVTRLDGKRFLYVEAQATSKLETDPEQTSLAAARYGIIRSQALTPRESLNFIEKLLGEL
ncbi:helix-turn-helix transcriptional regulator [Streptomyces sp. NPDC046860]|uniref:helix-turn-helix domain-containing protein n=1 Tax=Streptomyces sp. NPDC046860 TaxID=3154495 RepID=UPI003409F4A2